MIRMTAFQNLHIATSLGYHGRHILTTKDNIIEAGTQLTAILINFACTLLKKQLQVFNQLCYKIPKSILSLKLQASCSNNTPRSREALAYHFYYGL